MQAGVTAVQWQDPTGVRRSNPRPTDRQQFQLHTGEGDRRRTTALGCSHLGVIKAFMAWRTGEAVPMLLPFSKDALLQAIPGIAYVVDRDGIILALSRGPFMEDVRLPGAAASGYRHAKGLSLFSIIQGDQVRQGYRSMHDAAWSGRFDAFGFAYRCDAPDVERNMFMSISRIAEGTTTVAVLYQSIVVSELRRPPVPLFTFEALREAAPSADRIVSLCSYCQKVKWPVRGGAARMDRSRRVLSSRGTQRRSGEPRHLLCMSGANRRAQRERNKTRVRVWLAGWQCAFARP